MGRSTELTRSKYKKMEPGPQHRRAHRAVHRDHRKLGDQQSVGLLVEIGTPHAGANDAKLASALGISRELTEGIMRDSTDLNILTSQWFSYKNRPHTFCFTSPQDVVVSEQSALAFCDDGTEYPMWGHTEMVKPQDASNPRYAFPIRLIHQFMQP